MFNTVPLSDISKDIRYGLTASAQSEGSHRFIRITDITDNGILKSEAAKFVTPDTLSVKKFALSVGDLLVARSGSVGRACLITKEHQAVFASYLIRFRLNAEKADSHFVFYFTLSPQYRNIIKSQSRGAAIKNINANQLGSIPVPLPPIHEQRRIVARIKECLERVEEIDGLWTEAMQEALGIYPSRCHDFFAPNEQTEKWVSVSIGELAAFIQYGYTQSSTKAPIGPQFLRITDIQNHTVNWDSVPYCEADAKQTAKYKLAKNDILFARTGATTGKSFLIENEPPLSVFASYLIRLQLNQKQVLPRLIYHFFQSPLYWDQIHQNMRGGAQPNINSKVLASIKLTIPEDLEEQRDIVDRLDEAFSISMELIDLQQRQHEALGFTRKSILHKAFAGEL